MAILGDVNVMTSMLFGSPSSAIRDMMRRDHEDFMARAPKGWGDRFVQRSNQLFESFNGAAAMQLVQNALSHVKSAALPDMVYEFRSISQFQTAQRVMQEYIMANPLVRARYHAQLCDGYSDTYVDPAPGVIGFGHRAYEQVMDGVFELSDKPDESQYTSYSGAWINETAQALDVSQRAAILNSYAVIDKIFADEDRDPTSPWNASL